MGRCYRLQCFRCVRVHDSACVCGVGVAYRRGTLLQAILLASDNTKLLIIAANMICWSRPECHLRGAQSAQPTSDRILRSATDMLLKCPLSCGLCCCLDDESMKETPDPDWLLKSQHLSGAPCILDTRNPVPMYQKKNSHHGHAAERRRQLGCTYDNYSYTVVDAMVITATGRALWEWTLDLVARPLGMSDTLRCMAAPRRRERMSAQDDGAFRDIPGCHIPPSLAKLYQPDKWPLWQGGPESYAWPGVSMFTSAADFSRFMAMILGEGTVAGVKVISRESAKEVKHFDLTRLTKNLSIIRSL